MLGKVVVEDSRQAEDMDFHDPNTTSLTASVSRKQKQVFELPPREAHECSTPGESEQSQGDTPKPVHVFALDCGIKNNIIRYLVNILRVRLTVIPHDYDFTEEEFDGLFLSNGPGNPTMNPKAIEHIQKLMRTRPNVPIFGICLGNQLLALASGARTYKMKFGNRGMNQPCVDLRTTRCYITPQNHGFAVDA